MTIQTTIASTLLLSAGVLALSSTPALAQGFSGWGSSWSKRGDIKSQLQLFTEDALHTADHNVNASIVGNAEFSRDIGQNGTLTISPFFRVDQNDDQRTHADFREFIYSYSGESWEINVGLGKVFWGVTESDNIVDIINQKDFVEGVGAEHKLGQPMLNLLLLRDWGEISFFMLPGIRERTFAGEDGRPRGFFTVDTDNPEFESDFEDKNIDFAGRISGAIGAWDLGIHAFHGTAREPIIDFLNFTPLYFKMTQVGIDAQATYGSWLLKSEVVYQSGDLFDDHFQTVSGFEYNFYSLFDTNADVGIIAEWMIDGREEKADTLFQNDSLIGLRFALNDEQSTELLVGVISNLDGGGKTISVNASRRITDNVKFEFEAVVWDNIQADSFLSQFEQEDYVQFEVGYFF